MSKATISPEASAESLAWVGRAGMSLPKGTAKHVVVFDDSDDFLLSPGAFAHGFYVLDLQQRGVPGVDLVRLVRRRSTAGLVALSHAPHRDLAAAFDEGADVVLPAKSPADVIAAAISAVRRRVQSSKANVGDGSWRLFEASGTLMVPDGTAIDLSTSDLAILRCFATSNGAAVTRAEVAQALWGPDAGVMDNALHAALYRLRKRIEQAGQLMTPIHAVAGVGYEFRAKLVSS